ncbi:hypothetical protein Nepgr_005388 [Nepenthes gracilis]|uniref:Uncharacterized protein n=1 Tax=Nepenthes gracilis TaxID=150966 RepID=A0AAD3S3J9_NEPGR|nr:hypothetical protein Nepgr_005388 [Nepenthes gracilis]
MEPTTHPASAPSKLLRSGSLNLHQGSTAAISKWAYICSELEQAPSANSPAPHRLKKKNPAPKLHSSTNPGISHSSQQQMKSAPGSLPKLPVEATKHSSKAGTKPSANSYIRKSTLALINAFPPTACMPRKALIEPRLYNPT